MPLDLWCTIAQVGAPDLLAYLFLRAGRAVVIYSWSSSFCDPFAISFAKYAVVTDVVPKIT